MLKHLLNDNLIWFPEQGIGYYPVKDFPYNVSYFEKYTLYASTEMGEKITNARIDFVNKHFDGSVLDVGIGCGQFILSRENCFGFDINPVAVDWLKNKNIYRNLYDERFTFDALTFWDSLEHIEKPELAIQKSKRWVFLSMPIFGSLEGILNSKHYRKDEHFWYFTLDGLRKWFDHNGFEEVDSNDMEIELGRRSILTFAFRRKKNG